MNVDEAVGIVMTAVETCRQLNKNLLVPTYFNFVVYLNKYTGKELSKPSTLLRLC